MGPTVINGLPAHPLLVHIVVVLVPLSALMLVASVLWPAARRKLGFLTPLVALATLVAVPLTTHAGEWLKARTQPETSVLRHHADLGGQLIYWSAPVFVLALLWWLATAPRVSTWLAARAATVNTVATNRITLAVLGIAAVAVAVGSVIWVYRIGESGAQSVWNPS